MSVLVTTVDKVEPVVGAGIVTAFSPKLNMGAAITDLLTEDVTAESASVFNCAAGINNIVVAVVVTVVVFGIDENGSLDIPEALGILNKLVPGFNVEEPRTKVLLDSGFSVLVGIG